MTEWWSTLDTLEKTLIGLAVPATALFIIQSILIFLGMDGDSMDMDADVSDVDMPDEIDAENYDDPGDIGMAEFHMFTIKNLITFIMVFCWTALVGKMNEMNMIIVIVVSFILALGTVALVSYLLYLAIKNQVNGTENLNHALNAIGDVYLKIPGERGGYGKVQIKYDGRLRVVEAVTDGAEIATGGQIKVVRVIKKSYVVVTKV